MINNFYLVWEPESGYAKHKHNSITDACIEAERLARANRGREYYILKAEKMCISADIVWEEVGND